MTFYFFIQFSYLRPIWQFRSLELNTVDCLNKTVDLFICKEKFLSNKSLKFQSCL